jgi:membrane glycosyltransferase
MKGAEEGRSKSPRGKVERYGLLLGLVVGVLVGLFTESFAVWIAVGVVLGLVFSQERHRQSPEVKDGRDLSQVRM